MLFTFILSLLSVVVLANDAMLVEFDPKPELIMTTATGTFTVKLLQPPSKNAPITVSLIQPLFEFSNCQLTFTADNFNVPQTVEIIAAPSFAKDAKTVSVAASICAPDTDYSALEQSYKVTPKQLKGKTCKSTGDPRKSYRQEN